MNVYKNDLDETVRFRIEPHIGTGGIYLELQENGKRATTVFPPKDAPALALAILEAAGVEPDREPLDCQVSLGTIVADLQDTIKHNQAQAAAAKDQAELEAEALELFNQYRIATQLEPTGSWDEARPLAKEQWLAVARRAREMRAEK